MNVSNYHTGFFFKLVILKVMKKKERKSKLLSLWYRFKDTYPSVLCCVTVTNNDNTI